MKNVQLSKALSEIKFAIPAEERFDGLRAEARRYANLLVEAHPGRFVRAEALQVLARCKTASMLRR